MSPWYDGDVVGPKGEQNLFWDNVHFPGGLQWTPISKLRAGLQNLPAHYFLSKWNSGSKRLCKGRMTCRCSIQEEAWNCFSVSAFFPFRALLGGLSAGLSFLQELSCLGLHLKLTTFWVMKQQQWWWLWHFVGFAVLFIVTISRIPALTQWIRYLY